MIVLVRTVYKMKVQYGYGCGISKAKWTRFRLQNFLKNKLKKKKSHHIQNCLFDTVLMILFGKEIVRSQQIHMDKFVHTVLYRIVLYYGSRSDSMYTLPETKKIFILS